VHQKQRGRASGPAASSVSGFKGAPFIYSYDSESIRGFKPKEMRQAIFFVAGLKPGARSANAWLSRLGAPLV